MHVCTNRCAAPVGSHPLPIATHWGNVPKRTHECDIRGPSTLHTHANRLRKSLFFLNCIFPCIFYKGKMGGVEKRF